VVTLTSRRASSEDGSATVWVLVAATVLLFAVGATTAWGAAVITRHRAAAAADAAALAAATRLPGPVSGACAAARGIAVADGAALTGCRVSGMSVLVTTRVPAPRWLAFAGSAHGLACAGQIPADAAEPAEAGRRRNLAGSTSLCQVTTPPG
jgi:secretion/DNA translocation related TadE-like protein